MKGLLQRAAVTAAAGLMVIAAAPARGDLGTFGYSNARLGASPRQAGISVGAVPGLRIAWRARVGSAVNAQPLVADGVRAAGRVRNLVIAATEHGRVVALDARSGAVMWRRQVGFARIRPDCQASPDSVFGVTGTPVLDRRSGRVYVVDVNGLAWAFELGSGRVARGWPVRVHPRDADFVWGGLALSRGWLYVSIASLCDSGIYHGGVVAVDMAHPSRLRSWRTTAGTKAFGGGIWGWGGISIDARSGDVYAATGNSGGTSQEDEGNAESFVRLSAGLAFRDADDPLTEPFFIGDRDFGTTPVLIDARGCPPLAVAINKDGELFVYDRYHVSAGPRQRLAVAANSPSSIPLYGIPAFDPTTRLLVLVSPSTPPGSDLRAGVQAFELGARCELNTIWQQGFDAPNAGSAPTIGAGVVYIGSGRNGWLRAFRLRDGRPLWARRLSRTAIFAAPAVDGGTVFAADWAGSVFALRPRR